MFRNSEEHMTPKDHPSFRPDPDYSWDKIPKWSFGVPHQKMEVPDWRIYKVEGIPELEHVRDTLASEGLKDPWLRNEVWRYPPFWERNPMTNWFRFLWGTKMKSVKYALGITTVICSLEWLYYKQKLGDYPPHVTTLYHELWAPRHH